MRDFDFSERASTLEIQTYAVAVKVALRRCRVFLHKSRVVALRLPQGAALEAYKDAVNVVLKAVSLNHYRISIVTATEKGPAEFEDALYMVRYKAAVVVLVQYGAEMPDELMIALDRVVDVAPVDARHLVVAAKSSLAMDLPVDIARRLTMFSARTLFLAFRPERPMDDVLERLEAITTVAPPPKKPSSSKWEPRIEDLEGYGEAKLWATELIADLSDWRKEQIPWSDISSGILLEGPSGNGKTLFGEALARSCGAKFIPTSSAVWQSKGHLGDMLKAMRRSFDDAARSAPAVLQIDEIDAVGSRAKFTGSNADYNTQVVNALLELLDGAERREGIVVVATTNHPENVDPALKRAGRLERQVYVGLPDRSARQKMLALHLGVPSSGDGLSEAAIRTSGYSAADLAQAAKDARRLARRQRREVGLDDLLSVLPPLNVVSGDERWEACLHEAGHAVVGLELEVGKIESIVVARELGYRDESAGHVLWRRLARKNRSRQAYLNDIAMLLGGMAAEKVLLGDVHDGSGGQTGSDVQRVTDIATTMLVSLGLGPLQYSDVSSSSDLDKLRRSDPVLRERVETLLSAELARATEIIQRRLGDVETVAEAVFERAVVSGEEIQALISPQRRTG
jgi:ATP-dependent Zn protease